MVQRPRSNRVTPFGALERSAARGTIMGNRGDLHGRDGEIVRAWKVKAWIACTTVGKDGYRVAFDRPGFYAPLFALDEATMLAAGHRPCAQCRRDAFLRFKAAWARAGLVLGGDAPSAAGIDAVLHAARLGPDGRQRRHRAQAGDLPDGVMVATASPDPAGLRAAALIWRGRLRPWSHDGYGLPQPLEADAEVEVLTPEPTVAVLRAGYVPEVAP